MGEKLLLVSLSPFPLSIPSPSSLPHIHPSHHTLHPSSAGKTLIAGVGGVESNYLVQSIPCIKSHDHPDYPAILVFIEYLTALEVHTCMCKCYCCIHLHLDHSHLKSCNVIGQQQGSENS